MPTCLITRRKCQNWRNSRTKCSFCCAHVSRLESLIFLWRRRVYGEAAKPSNLFDNVSKVSKCVKIGEFSQEMLVLLRSRVSSRVSSFPVASPCLWGKLQNLSFSKVSKQVVMSFCVPGVALCAIPTCFILCRNFFCLAGFTLYTPHSTLHTPHFTHSTLYTLHSTLYTLHFTLYTLHSTLYILRSTLHTLHSSLHTPHSILHTLHFTLYTLHSTLYTSRILRSTLHTLHFTLLTPHSTLYTPRLHFTLCTSHSSLHTLHSTLHTLHSTHYTPHSLLYTPHSTLYTLHFTFFTRHSTLYILHSSLSHVLNAL